jgi:poly(hydroxyalkanoate) granule-associated protein
VAQPKNGSDGRESGWTNQIRKVLLAGVGAVVLAQEEVEDFVNKLVHKGEMAEKDGRKLLSDILAQRKRDLSDGGETLQSEISSGIEKVMHGMNLVSKGDIAELNRRLDELSKMLDRLESGGRKG